ncbi:hypothetical protein P279_12230 [Rhodobacteraceae bacterium PD-2]|nr:hypothetical protein P279_12230 [Rhodobacteraceae bacterium PD-2]
MSVFGNAMPILEKGAFSVSTQIGSLNVPVLRSGGCLTMQIIFGILSTPALRCYNLIMKKTRKIAKSSHNLRRCLYSIYMLLRTHVFALSEKCAFPASR